VYWRPANCEVWPVQKKKCWPRSARNAPPNVQIQQSSSSGNLLPSELITEDARAKPPIGKEAREANQWFVSGNRSENERHGNTLNYLGGDWKMVGGSSPCSQRLRSSTEQPQSWSTASSARRPPRRPYTSTSDGSSTKARSAQSSQRCEEPASTPQGHLVDFRESQMASSDLRSSPASQRLSLIWRCPHHNCCIPSGRRSGSALPSSRRNKTQRRCRRIETFSPQNLLFADCGEGSFDSNLHPSRSGALGTRAPFTGLEAHRSGGKPAAARGDEAGG